MDEDLARLLPAYCAGSLPESMYHDVESAILTSPELLSEAMELMIVNEHLLGIRQQMDAVTL